MAKTDGRLHRYRFGEFIIDERRGVLQCNGEDVPLRPKSWDVLRHLIRHRGELVTKQALLDAVWGDRVVTEGVLAKSVGEIRLALGDHAHEIIRTVPSRGYLFDRPVEAELVEDERSDEAGLAANVVDGAAAGPEPVSAGDPGSSLLRVPASGRRPMRPWHHGVAVSLLFAAVAVVWSLVVRDVDSTPRHSESRLAEPPETSIAVLPFADMSPEGDQQFLADGMAEEILNWLATSPDLTVVARTSSFAFRDAAVDVMALGRRLNVSYLLEGSLRRDGDMLRLGVQLVDVADGSRMWSASFDRPAGDTFQLQSEIARAVSDQLHVRLAGSAEKRPIDPDAYQRYLEARFRFNRRFGDDLLRAEQLYLEATEIDPHFARAWAGLAGVYWVRTDVTHDESIQLSMPEALEAMALPIERALRADPGLAEAHVRAFLYFFGTGDRARGREHLERARALAPNDSLVLASLAWRVDGLEPPEDEIVVQRRVVAVDPLSLTARLNLVYLLIEARLLTEARREVGAALSLFPAATGEFAYPSALIDLFEGDFEAAAAAAEALPDAVERLHERTALLAMAWDGLGMADRSVEAKTKLERVPGEWAALRLAEIHAHAGADGEAFAWLREASERAGEDPERCRRLWLVADDSPFLHDLKETPDWHRLKMAAGVAERC